MSVFVLILIGTIYHGDGHFAARPFPTQEACMTAAHALLPTVLETEDLKAYGVACAEVDLTEAQHS